MPMQIIAFGVFSDARRVTIYSTPKLMANCTDDRFAGNHVLTSNSLCMHIRVLATLFKPDESHNGTQWQVYLLSTKNAGSAARRTSLNDWCVGAASLRCRLLL